MLKVRSGRISSQIRPGKISSRTAMTIVRLEGNLDWQRKGQSREVGESHRGVRTCVHCVCAYALCARVRMCAYIYTYVHVHVCLRCA
jgi:hypothetical protein